jgi:hypothetical protein
MDNQFYWALIGIMGTLTVSNIIAFFSKWLRDWGISERNLNIIFTLLFGLPTIFLFMLVTADEETNFADLLVQLYPVIMLLAMVATVGTLVHLALRQWKTENSKKLSIKAVSIMVFAIMVLVLFCLALFNPPLSPRSDSSDDPNNTSTSTPDDVTISSPPNGGSSAPVNPTHGYYSERRIGNATFTGWLRLEDMLPDGEGTMRYPNGDIYTGDWSIGERIGVGTLLYRNGDIYEGEWRNGLRHGYGNYTWNDGRRYEGYYRDNLRHGIGTFTGWNDLTNGFEGTYVGMNEGDEFEGRGEFAFANGDMFEGIFKANVRWNGIYTHANGTKDIIEDGIVVH